MSKLEPAVRSPTEVATELGETYFYWKEAESLKEDYRKEFFGSVTRTFDTEKLARKTVVIPDDLKTDDERLAYVLRYNSGWRLVDDEGQLDKGVALIEEDPNLKAWDEIIILDKPVTDTKGKQHPGYVVTKTIVAGSALLDDERLKKLDPDFYNEVTEWRNHDTLADMLYNSGVDVDEVESTLDTWLGNVGWDRVIRQDLDAEQKETIKEYSYEGPKQVRLNVRYAKDDETPGG